MEGSGNHIRIMEIGQTLMNQNILANAVAQELEKYNGRREALMDPVLKFFFSFSLWFYN